MVTVLMSKGGSPFGIPPCYLSYHLGCVHFHVLHADTKGENPNAIFLEGYSKNAINLNNNNMGINTDKRVFQNNRQKKKKKKKHETR